MEKQFNREEDFLKKLLNEAVIEKPSADFKSKVMMRIEANKASVKAYKPLISGSVWFLLAALKLAVGGFYFHFSEAQFAFSGNFDLLRLEIPELNFPIIKFSKIMQYAVAFVALFFFQIPFLKNFMDRQYEVTSINGKGRSPKTGA